MRSLVTVLAMVLFVCCFTSASYALSVGFPYDTEKDNTHFFFAVEDSYLFGKDIDTSDNVIDSGSVDTSNAAYAKIGYAFSDYLGVYTKLGAQNLEMDMDVKSATNKAAYDVEFDMGFMWAIGLCGAYEFENSGVRIGWDLQYGQASFDVKKLTVNGTAPGTFSGSSPDMSEVSIAVLAGKKFDLGNEEVKSATPYAGIRYSNANIDFGTVTHTAVQVGGVNFTGFSGSVDSKYTIGLFVGCDVDIYDSFIMGLEARFLDENAVSINGTYKF